MTNKYCLVCLHNQILRSKSVHTLPLSVGAQLPDDKEKGLGHNKRLLERREQVIKQK